MLGTKFLRSIVFGHGTRIVAFMLTTVPAPRSNCAKMKFHLDADAEWSWKEAATHRGGGGCNDLIFSGHFVIIMNTCLLFNEVYDEYCGGRNQRLHKFTKWYLRTAALFSAMDMVRGGHHYSVDVYLAFLVTMLYWKYASHPTAYWYVPLELKSKAVQSELRASWLLKVINRFNIKTQKRQKILITSLVLLILFIAGCCVCHS